MHLRTWAHSVGDEGARSQANCRLLDALLRLGSLVVTDGVTITVDQAMEGGIPCLRINFCLPQAFHSTGIRSIPILVPAAWVGTGNIQPNLIFYALIEEIIGWLAGVGPKHTFVRQYRNNNGEPLARSHSASWVHLHRGFSSFINILRDSHHQFPGLGQMSGAFGVIEVARAMTSSQEATADYIVTLTLNNRQRMSLLLPRRVAQLPREWMLDWIEVRNEFSSQS